VDFTAAAGDLAEAGVAIIGVSPDPPDKLRRFREQESLSITLVSDPDKQVLRAYGAYGPKKLYGKEVVGVIRSTFVVDAQGRIETASYNVKATGHVAKLRRELGLG
jgi:peroxiredoxin Q/BCP